MGALARYGSGRWIGGRSDGLFPSDTFLVNVLGCFAAGVLVAVIADRGDAPEWLRLGLLVGFLGAYTTFSAFAHDIYGLHVGRDYVVAVLYAVLSVGVGIAGVVAGIAVGRLI